MTERISPGHSQVNEQGEQKAQPGNSSPPDPLQVEGQASPIPGSDLPLEEKSSDPDSSHVPRNLSFIMDIPLEISVELGRTKMRIADILKLGQGSIIELNNPAGSSLEVLVNQKPIAKGEVVVVNEKYGIRLIEILSIMERIEKLR
ncbi:MAG: flagellar motor switch protein FliN [bacterium]